MENVPNICNNSFGNKTFKHGTARTQDTKSQILQNIMAALYLFVFVTLRILLIERYQKSKEIQFHVFLHIQDSMQM